MNPATRSKRFYEETKLMVVEPNAVSHTEFGRLAERLNPGDLLVVNSSGTLPSSYEGRVGPGGERVELRLAAFRGKDPSDLSHWAAVAFGAGDWTVPTERRGLPPRLRTGDRIAIGADLVAQVTQVDASFPRLLHIEFHSSALTRRLYEHGQPIQYSYLEEKLKLWDQQTLFGGPPISVEPPSASFSLTWAQLLGLRRRGIGIATVLHSAGISSSGHAELDALFPLEEYFEVSEKTRRLVVQARGDGHRVVALGTTVARALESAFLEGADEGFRGSGFTSLKLGPRRRPRVTDALITGMHAEGTSHAELMKAFCGCETLRNADREASRRGYRSHEFGDLALLDCGTPRSARRA